MAPTNAVNKIRCLVCLLVFVNFFLFYVNGKAETSAELAYQTHNIYGWQVMISNQVVDDSKLYQRLLKQIDKDLFAITQAVPIQALTDLRQTKIWFEKKLPKPMGNNLFFNGSKKLSKKHNIQHLYGGVIAGSTRAYLAVSGIHPWQLLHELTHAYHQFVIHHSFEPILKAYQNALSQDLHRFGNQYARKNKKEYFSTLSEAYFGKDANYPHNKKQLAAHDPIGFCAIVQAWGIIQNQEDKSLLSCEY